MRLSARPNNGSREFLKKASHDAVKRATAYQSAYGFEACIYPIGFEVQRKNHCFTRWRS